jgi:hypothetical protein
MSTSFIFGNKQITLPGAYSRILSGETSPARTLDYSKTLIVDTGVYGANWGGGSGIDGENFQGLDSVYKFDTLAEFRSFIKGGMFWKIAEGLFIPDYTNPASIGISQLLYVRAAKTTSATLTFTTTAGGTFEVKTLDEGLGANGKLSAAGNLIQGYGYTLEAGEDDPAKWIMKFYVSSFTGYAADGYPIGETPEDQASPTMVLQSPEFDTIGTLIDWAKSDSNFANLFVLTENAEEEGDGKVTQSDVTTALAGKDYVLATGGTETYNTDNLTKALEAVTGLDYSFIMTDQFGDNADSVLNSQVLAHINSQAKYTHFMFVGGYDDSANFSKSIDLAKGFNSEVVQLVHGGAGMTSGITGVKTRWWGVMYNLCCVLGRTAGKPPYIPVTNKTIGIDKLKHTLNDTEKKKALDAGLLVTVYNDYTNNFVVLQGVNTLQDNKVLFNSNGQSHSIQFMRIVAQINKELVVNASIDLLGQENGVNVNTLSAGAVKDWTVAYLQSRVANEAQDNLLLSFKDVLVTRQEDAWFVTYKIVVNNEINKLFFTGFLIRG